MGKTEEKARRAILDGKFWGGNHPTLLEVVLNTLLYYPRALKNWVRLEAIRRKIAKKP